MEYIKVSTTEGIKEEIIYNIYDFPYEILNTLPTCRKAKKCTYYNVSSAFDIECTTIETKKDSNGKYLTNPYAFMYHWQFCIDNKVVFGRTWEEFQEFFRNLHDFMDLSDGRKLVVYVHNLAYEFQFMKNFIEIESIFAKDKRKPMKVTCTNGIEFRCSYFLSNMSLSKFCENSKGCIHYKLVDTFDYKKIRTPDTPLTNDEKGYCYNDVRGLCECIDFMLESDTIATIPLTNTGFVRRDYRTAMNTPQNRAQFLKLSMNTEEYQMCKRAFRGGNTHANRFYSGVTISNVYSFDISSSYPSSIMMDEYPISKFTECKLNNINKINYFCENYCVIMDVVFRNIELNYDVAIPYIPVDKCWKQEEIVNDNGRILKAKSITMSLTNIDLDIIRKTYHFYGDRSERGFMITKAYYAKKGKLPIEMRNTMMSYFHDKTMLKGIDNKEYEYAKSKNKLNSTFGMCVTAIDHSEITYNSESFKWKEIAPDLNDSLDKFYKSRNNFLSYQWGIFVTANSRKRLQTMLDVVGMDVIYIDTDSIKFINDKHIKEFEEMNKKLQSQAENNDIPGYVDRDGERFYLGTWDNDGNYRRFKTLGAKKYCYEITEKKDKPDENIKKGDITFHITVSGMSKKEGAKAVGSIENFKIGKTFSNVGRTTSWYNDCESTQITIDNCTFTSASNIGILETTYTLGVSDTYFELIAENITKDLTL